jgi:hypothetical protein
VDERLTSAIGWDARHGDESESAGDCEDGSARLGKQVREEEGRKVDDADD